MKLMKTQGASDAMQMAHYKLTIIIIIIITLLTLALRPLLAKLLAPICVAIMHVQHYFLY